MPQQGSHLEIERRWLLRNLPPWEILRRPDTEYADITTIYIVSDDQLEARIKKRKDSLGNITFPVVMKIGLGLVRQETPKLLASEWVYLYYHNQKDPYDCSHERLLPRHGEDWWRIHLPNGRKVEVKRFKGMPGICGLTLAEIEFKSEEKARKFSEKDFPHWLRKLIVKEVTEDPRYNSKSLAVFGRPNPE